MSWPTAYGDDLSKGGEMSPKGRGRMFKMVFHDGSRLSVRLHYTGTHVDSESMHDRYDIIRTTGKLLP